VRSRECEKRALKKVADAAPIATPMMVPLAPKAEAKRAATTALPIEAMIWR
jgi:hypothetical protein